MLFNVDAEKCNYCGICVEVGGRNIIEMKDKDSVPIPVYGADELCNNCGHCVVA